MASETHGPLNNGTTRLLRLPFIYNVAFSASYSYGPAARHFADRIRVVHFLGANNKPWTRSRIDTAAPGLHDYTATWWRVYDASIVSYMVHKLGGLGVFGLGTASTSQPGPVFPSAIESHIIASDPGVKSALDTSVQAPIKALASANAQHYRVQWPSDVQQQYEKCRPASKSVLSVGDMSVASALEAIKSSIPDVEAVGLPRGVAGVAARTNPPGKSYVSAAFKKL